jgi:hypothetical protein
MRDASTQIRPRQSDPDAAAIHADQMAYERPEEVVLMPTYRSSNRKHYFRTDPGHRVGRIRIPGAFDSYSQDVGREDGKTPIHDFYQRLYEKNYPDPATRALHEAVRDANNGEWFITFDRIPNKFEGFLETDSDVLAEYVRSLMASGQLPYVYEDVRTVPTGVPSVPAHRAVAALRLQKEHAKETAA